ncbi:hypothetical protein WME88_58075 [Sorangium sp. So ce216]
MADVPTQIVGDSYTFDLTAAGRGAITIEVEGVPGYLGRKRPRRAHGTVVLVRPPARDLRLVPAAVEDEEWTQLKEMSFEGGHIVGLNFGGPDHEMNLAPMNKGANLASGLWGQIEWHIKSHSKGLVGGAHLEVDLTLFYTSEEPRIPSRVSGSIESVAGVAGARTTLLKINSSISPPLERTNYLTKDTVALFRDIEQAAQAKGFGTLERTPETPNAPLDVIDYKNDPVSVALRTRIRQAHPELATYPVDGFRKGVALVLTRNHWQKSAASGDCVTERAGCQRSSPASAACRPTEPRAAAISSPSRRQFGSYTHSGRRVGCRFERSSGSSCSSTIATATSRASTSNPPS